jgi:hypothetical protein
MHVTLEGLWVKYFLTTKGTNSFPYLVPMGRTYFGLSSAFPFTFHVMVSAIGFLVMMKLIFFIQ